MYYCVLPYHHKKELLIMTMTMMQDATLELRVRTVKYFKDMWNVHASLNEDLSEAEMRKLSLGESLRK